MHDPLLTGPRPEDNPPEGGGARPRVPDLPPRCRRCGVPLDTTLHSIDAANIAAGTLLCQRCVLAQAEG